MRTKKQRNALALSVGITLGVLALSAPAGAAPSVTWFDGTKAVTYGVSEAASPVVSVALDMLSDDLRQVTGHPIAPTRRDNAIVQIYQMDKESRGTRRRLGSLVPVDSLCGLKEAFFITARQGRIIVAGSDARGTAYGILELSRLAGVSPWVWWNDVTPERQERLSLPEGFRTLQSPSVEYRGIFLNDEDWSLQPWSWKTFEPNDRKGHIGARTYKEIFKLLLRLRANTIWPGMHGLTVPFYYVEGAKEAADSCGIVIGTSHCEPMMRNNVGEWNVEERGRYNYITNRTAVQAYWTERLKEVAPYENIYTIGMRGIHDGSMEGVKTLEEKTAALQQVINDQRDMLARYVNKNVEQIPQQFVPYKEVLQIMENGLVVPDDVTLTWCDDNYGYMTRLSDSTQQKRSGGGGIYYHLSYWGRPHDYMWLCTTQPGLIYSEMKQAYDLNVRRLWIVNVHDPKVAAYDLELFLDMAWNVGSVSPATLVDHLKNWLCREFGDRAGEQLLPAMQEFYRLCAIRKPEFMGWNQVELDKQKFFKGWSPVANSEFSLTEFGGELDHYLAAYADVKRSVAEAERFVPASRRDAFFAQVKYPVFCAAAMSVKALEAQRARNLYQGSCDTNLWTREEQLNEACARSIRAYEEIRALTDYYNTEMAGGKWAHSMCHNPRDLYVFYPPQVPLWVKSEVCDGDYTTSHPRQTDSCIASNACDYDRASVRLAPIPMLGHSTNAVPLPKGETVSYDFESAWQGEVLLHTAVIPTHPQDTGDIRFSVSIDGGTPQVCSFKEGYRSEGWKQNVLRGQARRTTRHHLSAGRHTLTITALDEHVCLDQWMIDFNPDRKFYLFPVTLNH